ncbi:MAG TPA: hypothetical protein VNO30_34180, partial [Kofleriaceae bacterium]|nr:hypothetical protein [Kofleriaceae bacterium]
GLAIIAAWCCWSLIQAGHSPRAYDPYRFRRLQQPIDWVYPADEIATWVITIAIEALVMALILRCTRASTAAMCFLLALLTGPLVLFFGMFAMHAPSPYITHLGMLFFSTAWLLVMTPISGIVSLVMRDRAAEKQLAEPPLPELPPARVVRR